MLNLIPALLLLLVNGPAAPLSDKAMLGSDSSVHRDLGVRPSGMGAIVEFALRMVAEADEPQPALIATGDSPSRSGSREIPGPLAALSQGYFDCIRSRDGPARLR